jgi:glutamine amidotransferase
VRSDLVIAHVRRSSVGEPKLKNTHPFERELWGRSFVLAHNGTVSAVKRRFILTHYQPIGDTDSEHAFCWLLERFRETLASFADFSRPEALSFVRERAREIGELGTFNFLMSDSERLFAFRSALSDSRHKLHYLLRHAPFRTVRLKDPSNGWWSSRRSL